MYSPEILCNVQPLCEGREGSKLQLQANPRHSATAQHPSGEKGKATANHINWSSVWFVLQTQNHQTYQPVAVEEVLVYFT